jgi:hypothetical protein
MERPEIAEVDCNKVIAWLGGCLAVDALVVLEALGREPYAGASPHRNLSGNQGRCSRRGAPRPAPRRTGRGRRAVAALLVALERLGTEQPEIADVDSRHQRWCAESPHFAALPLRDHAGFLLGRSVVWTSRESLGREGSQGMATQVRLYQRTSPGIRSLRWARDRSKTSPETGVPRRLCPARGCHLGDSATRPLLDFVDDPLTWYFRTGIRIGRMP